MLSLSPWPGVKQGSALLEGAIQPLRFGLNIIQHIAIPFLGGVQASQGPGDGEQGGVDPRHPHQGGGGGPYQAQDDEQQGQERETPGLVRLLINNAALWPFRMNDDHQSCGSAPAMDLYSQEAYCPMFNMVTDMLAS